MVFTAAAGAQERPATAQLPTLWIIGDSTVKNGTRGQVGWGDPIADFFDKSKIRVENRAIGGRSSRTFQTEGRWDRVLGEMKAGDFVIMQFGHNDGGALDDSARARGSIRGTGEETREIDNPITKKKEVVHTYGWYMRKYVTDAKAKGAVPVVVSPVPRNIWKDGHVARASKDYGKWAKESAEAAGAYFIDLNEIAAKKYEAAGEEKVKTEYFGEDHTHTKAAGAKVNAEAVVEGIRELKDCALKQYLSVAATPGGAGAGPVRLMEDEGTFTLSNDRVTAKVSKRTGDLVSLRYKDMELLGGGSGHPYGYWSHTPGHGEQTATAVTIDPQGNDGGRAEVSVKGIANGKRLGSGPGGSTICDVDIRYSMGREDSGVYTYCTFEHKADYPATSIGEARFGVKLNGRVFDWMTIDAKRNKKMPAPEDWDKGTPLNMKEARRMNTGIYAGQVEHKYDYSAIQFDIPAFGWSGTKDHVGLWFVNPSIEYLSGGATKVELTGHLDNNAGAAPTLLNYWRGSHYGGSSCVIGQSEPWTKVIGPFLIYCNSGETPEGMWTDALRKGSEEQAAWPYAWVKGVDYPHKEERGAVGGQLVLKDPPAPGAKMSNVLVGLAHPDYTPPSVGGGGRVFGPRVIDWQMDAKYYEFWTRADSEGKFTIAAVRPGTYTLHAIADGVLGEFAKAEVVVEAGKAIDLGRLEWRPVRFGKQVWEIGVPNRSGGEFRHGEHYWQWGLYLDYSREFPGDVDFVIGRSDWSKDWNFCQCPRKDRPQGTTWAVRFDLPDGPRGRATLRLGIAAASARNIAVSVNDKPAGSAGPLMETATIRRDGIRGYWQEKDVAFDAALMKPGENVLKLTIPPGNEMNGIIYDYLRLELDESAAPPKAE